MFLYRANHALPLDFLGESGWWMRGEKEKERGRKRWKKRQKLKSSFINAVFITDVYMQYSGEFAIVLEDNKGGA